MNDLYVLQAINSTRQSSDKLGVGDVSYDNLSLNTYANILDVSGISLVPVTSLPSEVQYYFNVTPYAMIKEGGITIDKHEEE